MPMSGVRKEPRELLIDEALLAGLGALAPGRQLGAYELLAPIGRGGMAVVWAARRAGTRGLGQLVAVKTMLPALSADPYFEKMFALEARVASRLRHPNVCEVFDHGEGGGVLFLAMEWVEGESLATLAAGGRVPVGVGARIALDVARGLHEAHELRDDAGKPLGVVHRDVSPENVLVGLDGVSKIADFGVAKATLSGERGTKSGYQKGKTRYMSPEQAYCEAIDRRTDVFAWGLMLYEVTTGQHPFAAATAMGILARIGDGEPARPPEEVVEGYPPALARVVAKALAKSPDERYTSMSEVVDDLSAVVQDLPASSADDVGAFALAAAGTRTSRRAVVLRDVAHRSDAAVDVPVTTAPPSRRRRAVQAASAAAAVAALAVAVTWLARGSAAAPQATPMTSEPAVAAATLIPSETALAAIALPTTAARDEARIPEPIAQAAAASAVTARPARPPATTPAAGAPPPASSTRTALSRSGTPPPSAAPGASAARPPPPRQAPILQTRD